MRVKGTYAGKAVTGEIVDVICEDVSKLHNDRVHSCEIFLRILLDSDCQLTKETGKTFIQITSYKGCNLWKE